MVILADFQPLIKLPGTLINVRKEIASIVQIIVSEFKICNEFTGQERTKRITKFSINLVFLSGFQILESVKMNPQRFIIIIIAGQIFLCQTNLPLANSN